MIFNLLDERDVSPFSAWYRNTWLPKKDLQTSSTKSWQPLSWDSENSHTKFHIYCCLRDLFKNLEARRLGVLKRLKAILSLAIGWLSPLWQPLFFTSTVFSIDQADHQYRTADFCVHLNLVSRRGPARSSPTISPLCNSHYAIFLRGQTFTLLILSFKFFHMGYQDLNHSYFLLSKFLWSTWVLYKGPNGPKNKASTHTHTHTLPPFLSLSYLYELLLPNLFFKNKPVSTPALALKEQN